MKEQTEQLRARVSKRLYKSILEYAAFQGMNKSKATRELLIEGLVKMTYIGMLKRLQKELTEKGSIIAIEHRPCEKCGAMENVGIHHIDGNIYNMNSENTISLCRNCKRNLEKFMRKNPEERFVAWFFLN